MKVHESLPKDLEKEFDAEGENETDEELNANQNENANGDEVELPSDAKEAAYRASIAPRNENENGKSEETKSASTISTNDYMLFSCGRDTMLPAWLTGRPKLEIDCSLPFKDSFIPNSTGLAKRVQESILKNRSSLRRVTRKAAEAVESGKVVIFRCARGRHRSVACCELLSEKLRVRGAHLALARVLADRGEVLGEDGMTKPMQSVCG